MGNRIEEHRLARNWSYRRVAREISANIGAPVEGSTIRKLEKGDMELNTKWMGRLAGAFRVPVTELIEAEIQPTLVVGAVEAGAWVEALEWPSERRYSIQVPMRHVPRRVRTFGLEVQGTSMNRRYAEGTVLICAKLIDLDEEPEPGRRYVVYRHRGSLTEATVKLLKADKTGVLWLWPESDDPAHQSSLPLTGEPGETIEIAARVLMRVQSEDDPA